MDDFYKTIGQVADIFDGPHATPVKTDVGPYFLSISSLEKGRLNLSKSAHLSEADFKKWTKRVTPKKGDLLFSYETRLGEAALMPDGVTACLGRRMGLLRPHSDKVISEYLLYAYLSPAFQQTIIANTITGATVDRIALNEMIDFPIRIPSIEDQRKVSELLKDIDSKIECNNQIDSEIESTIRFLYNYWFVQFDFPDKNGRPYKSSGGRMVFSPNLKKDIPEGWCDVLVGDILDKAPATTKVLNQDILEIGDIPVVDQGQRYICGFTDDRSSLIQPIKPHVIFGDHTRLLKLVNFQYARGADGTQVLISKDSRMPGYLMYQAISNIDLSNYGYARHFKFLKQSIITLSDEELAQKYDLLVTPFFEKRRELIFENFELTKLRDWLLPMLINGQITVS